MPPESDNRPTYEECLKMFEEISEENSKMLIAASETKHLLCNVYEFIAADFEKYVSDLTTVFENKDLVFVKD